MGVMSDRGTELWFRRLMDWVSAAGFGPMSRSRSCACVDDVVAYYERCGGYLALLYAIGATDIREGPVATDSMHLGSSFNLAEGFRRNSSRGEPGALGVALEEMSRSVFRLGIVAARSLPFLRGKAVDILTYGEELVRGFERMYGVLWRNRERLLGTDGPIRRRIDDGGVGSWVLPVPVLMAIEQRVEALAAADLARQRWLLRAAIVSATASALQEEPRRALARASVAEAVGRNRFLLVASAVAERLEALAIETQSEVTWLGILPEADAKAGRWTVGPLGIDLHSGLAGVVWFLARLSYVTGNGRWRRLAGRAAQAWVAQAAACDREISVGAFVGWGGLVYVAAHLFSLWRERVWLERAVGWRSRMEEFLPDDQAFDLRAGAAGAILGLAALQAVERTEHTRKVIRACAEHLLGRASRTCIDVALGLTVAARETGDIRYARAARRMSEDRPGGLVSGLSIAWHQQFEQWDFAHLERLVSQGAWRCGTPCGLETPGLMLGLAGLGDRLLRAAEPSLPGVFGLEPPRGASHRTSA